MKALLNAKRNWVAGGTWPEDPVEVVRHRLFGRGRVSKTHREETSLV